MLKNSKLLAVGLEASFGSDAIRLCYARQRGNSISELRLDLLVRCIGPSRHSQAGRGDGPKTARLFSASC